VNRFSTAVAETRTPNCAAVSARSADVASGFFNSVNTIIRTRLSPQNFRLRWITPRRSANSSTIDPNTRSIADTTFVTMLTGTLLLPERVVR
jgi:hypothetical protein